MGQPVKQQQQSSLEPAASPTVSPEPQQLPSLSVQSPMTVSSPGGRDAMSQSTPAPAGVSSTRWSAFKRFGGGASGSSAGFLPLKKKSSEPFVGTGQAFVSFRASALAGEVVKKHREVRSAWRLRLDNFGLRGTTKHHRRPHMHSHTRQDGDSVNTPLSATGIAHTAHTPATPAASTPAGGSSGGWGTTLLTPFVYLRRALGLGGKGALSGSSAPAAAGLGLGVGEAPANMQSRYWRISFAPKPSDIMYDIHTQSTARNS